MQYIHMLLWLVYGVNPEPHHICEGWLCQLWCVHYKYRQCLLPLRYIPVYPFPAKISVSWAMYTICPPLVVTKSLGPPLDSNTIASHDLVSYWYAYFPYPRTLHSILVRVSSKMRQHLSDYNVCIPCVYGNHSNRTNLHTNRSLCVSETQQNKKTMQLIPAYNGQSFEHGTTLY